MIDPQRLRQAYNTVRRDLLAERDPTGHWTGRLSGSALSTATAVSALAIVARHADQSPGQLGWLMLRGIEYLDQSQNEDGGFGDTDKSVSNIATTMLVRAALHLAGATDSRTELLRRAEAYIDAQGGIAGLRRRYGRDKTFAVPILANCALAGLVPWREVSPLPFELACFPHAVFRFLRMQVVSYAIPALVAIGQARYFHCKPKNPITRLVRRAALGKSLEVLRRMQPDSGGYLEATPLTSFVVMSLAGSGRADHAVVRSGVQFLVDSARHDGSWPIDTNLATWITTLSINALAASGEPLPALECADWLLGCQHQEVHRFTNSPPGGWAWSDLSGAVPDADDTPGALLALANLEEKDKRGHAAFLSPAQRGVQWLLDMQNTNGGWPTFCRGWGKLPFDRSGVDLTAHVIRALDRWGGRASGSHRRQTVEGAAPALEIAAAMERGFRFLAKQQRDDGSWTPLWFGNQFHPEEENPVYGTARTLLAYAELGKAEETPAIRGARWLVSVQRSDGAWGPVSCAQGVRTDVSSVEETAVALEALIALPPKEELEAAISSGLAWLVDAIEADRYRETQPIGLYFAKLWYYERMYPIAFSVAALGRAARRYCGDTPNPPS